MADLTDIQAAQSVKVIGSNSSGVETNPLAVDSHQTAQVGLYDSAGNVITAASNGTAGNQLLHVQTPDTTTASTALGALNATISINTAGLSSVGFQLAAGTLIGTVVPECSIDGGTTWVSCKFFDPVSSSISTNLTFSASNTLTIYSVLPLGGSSNVRVRVSAYTSGTANALMRASQIKGTSQTVAAASSYFHPTFTLRAQAVAGNTGALATSLVISISSTSAGNLIAVSVSSSVAGTVTVTDNLAQTYSTAISGTSGVKTSYIFYKANTASGVTSITISSTSSSGICAIVTEYSGISTSPLDRTSTGTVTGTTAFSSGSTATTTSAVELLLGSAYGTTKNNQTYTPETGWTSISTSNGFNGGAGQLYVEDTYVGAIDSYAATGTASGNDTIIGNIATFIVTNTNLMPLNSPKLIKSGYGILRKIIINTIGTGSPILTLYDNTTNSGTVIAALSLSSALGSIDYNLYFTTGLTLVVNSTTADFTLVYD